MKRLRALLIGAALVLCVLVGRAPALATDQSPTQSYCAAWGVLSGALLRNWEAPLALAAGCGIQFGDLFTDGPLYNPTPSLSSLTFTVPANTWIAQGQKVVVTSSTNLTMTNNTNNWVWLDCNSCSGTAQGVFESTTSSSPPHSYSTLMYIVVASGGSIISYTPTFINTLLASGFLQVYGSVATGVNQAVIAATNATSCCQLELYTTSQNASIGTTPLRAMDDATDCVTGAGEKLFDFINHSNASVLLIGCSDTGSLTIPSMKLSGNAIFTGQFTDNTNILNGGLPQGSNSAECGSSVTVETNCFAGLPIPMATATPLTLNDSGAALSTAPLWGFDATDPQCTESGTHQNGYVLRIRNDTPTDLYHETCSGQAVFSNLGTVNSTTVAAFLFQMTGTNQCDSSNNSSNLVFQLKDDLGVSLFKMTCNATATFTTINVTGLKHTSFSSTTLPVVGSSTATDTQANIGGYYASPAPAPTASAATGTSANTYAQTQTGSVTLGTSYGAQGKWYGEVFANFWVTGGTSGAPVYGCIESASTVTTVTATFATDASNVICRSTPTNQMAGTVLFGNTVAPAYEETINQTARWTGFAANGATVTFTANVAGTSTTSINVFSSMSSIWWPI